VKGLLFGLLLASSLLAQAPAAPSFGRYVGILKHDNLKKEQLAKLDFVVSRSAQNQLELRAVLSLQFGDFKSGEYVSYHYEKVRYNLLTGTLVFSETEMPFAIYVKNFSGDDLEGEVVSLWGGKVGTLVLSRTKPAKPSAPLIEPLWGEYTGKCGPEKAKLQLYTFRSTEDLAHQSQPFAAYFIKANLPIGCKAGSCVTLRFNSGAYNFYRKTEQLTLVGNNRTFTCTVGDDTLQCGSVEPHIPGTIDLRSCEFKRTSFEVAEPRQLAPIENVGIFPQTDPNQTLAPQQFSALQSGEYRGYVFHEYTGMYQAASLNFNVFQDGGTGGTKIASQGKLFFGDHSSPEMIPYGFSENAYPNPLAGPQNVVLSRVDANIDAVVQITSYESGVLKGIWYSLIFGRVGPFEMKLNALPTLPSGAKVVQRLTGVYRGLKTIIPSEPNSQWMIKLAVVPGTKPGFQSENPFFPNLLRGSMMLYPITPNEALTDGSYDFYTGRFGFVKTNKEGNEHAWIGTQVSREELQLIHLSHVTVGIAPKHKPEIFRLE
jgi:hypothetical protein